ncbi:protein ACCELERATED CELL DEATH 6-like isoform X1 [Typha latifolia]|uniref:protein ACCELERATED CELL DEATH 6-like isoform X1 n=1 Tax=Typha latifolia TaxID=4733 RepID=UPI003C2CDF40
MERSDIQGPRRIPMDPKLLRAAGTGDKSLLERLLPSIATAELAIAVPNNGDVLSAQDDPAEASILRGVTVGGNTALHIAATHGHLELAEMICERERSLVVARNVMLETPLHCAASAGHHQVVSSIVSFTRDSNGIGVDTALRARNRDGRTALHEAARNGHVDVAVELMSADPGLADMVDHAGISPSYLATMAESLAFLRILQSFTSKAPFPISYAGPNGQTALHAATFLQNSEIANELLKWNQILAKITDKSGSTPLHYAASAKNDKMVKLLLEHDTCLAYISDLDGLFPVHVAATMGRVGVISAFIEQCPDLDELLDNKGRNLLHTAVEHKSTAIVRYICERSELVKLMNARDYEGNTHLHLAVRNEDQDIVSLLIRNKRVCLNIMNNEGLTPLDLSIIGVEDGLTYVTNPAHWILMCLQWNGARYGPRRMDHVVRKDLGPEDLEKESKKHASLSQSFAISTVVIATMAFGAAFALPGGYRADGTPTLARRYTFKAFVIADTFAFIFSVLSTYFITFDGAELMSLRLRRYYVAFSIALLGMATRILVATFALAIYLVLAPVSNSFGIAVCVITSTSELLLHAHTIPLCKLAITMKSRVGWTGLFKSQVRRLVWSWFKYQIPQFLGVSFIYISIFLLPLL